MAGFMSKIRVAAARLRRAPSAPADPASAARLQEEQYAAVRRNTPGMMAANVCNAFVLLWTLIDTPLAPRAVVWTNVLLLVVVVIYLRARRPRGASRRGPRGPTRVGRRAVAYAFILSSLWAAAPALFFIDADPGARLVIVSLTAGMLFGGAFALARAPLAATAFAGPIAIASAATLVSSGDADHRRIAMVLAVYVAALARALHVDAESFRRRMLTQIDAEVQARTDALTGLPNRLGFSHAIEQAFALRHRSNGGFLLLCVDLDRFKKINDSLGHPAGDALLVQAAQRMRATLRSSDVVARLGGDEFAIVAADVANPDAAGLVAGRIVSCFDAPFVIEGRAVKGSASVGGALAPGGGTDQTALLKSADVALYRAKQAGGGAWRLFEEPGEPALRDAGPPGEDLRHARALGQLALVFEPVVDLASGAIVGCEALLRWTYPPRGALGPAVFMPLAQRLGLVEELVEFLIEEAACVAAGVPDDFRVVVAAPSALLRRSDAAERILAALARAQAAPRALEIAVAETAASEPAVGAGALKLARAGFCVALDEFGAGRGALAGLRSPPFDKVIIDAALARAAPADRRSAAMVAGVIRTARDLGLRVAARGVQTQAQALWLRDAGCDLGQGPQLGDAMAQAELEELISRGRPPERVAAREKRA